MVFFTLAKLRGDDIPYGPWSIRNRKVGLAINFFAIVWAVLITIFLPFPPLLPVTASNMNYSGPLMGAAILWALVDWCWNGRKRWRAPLDRKDVEAEEREDE